MLLLCSSMLLQSVRSVRVWVYAMFSVQVWPALDPAFLLLLTIFKEEAQHMRGTKKSVYSETPVSTPSGGRAGNFPSSNLQGMAPEAPRHTWVTAP